MGLNQIKVSGPRFRNILPTSLKTQTSIAIFIKDLKEYFEESMGKINDRLEEIEKKAERNESNLIIISNYI